MAQFPMGRNTGRNFPVRGPGLDELLELLQNQGLTTQDENTKQRLESLRRADAGTSPLRARLYESLYKTGPVDIGEMTVDQERMPSSVDNSMRFGNTTYAEQGPPIIGGNVPTQRESASFSIPASVVNDMNRKPLLDPSLSRRTPAMQTERLQREADREVAADNYESQGPPTFMQQGRDVDIIGGESSRSAGADEREPTGGQSVGLTDPRAKAAKPATQTTDTATEPTTDADQQSLLSRIGGLIANNPELAASGAQLLGGLISNAAQNRAQRRADRTTNQRVARANLISALTGGRARPTVERAQADTGGFMSLDTLGKALQGGGAAYKSELARQVAEDERKRKAGLEQSAADLDKRAAELAERRFELAETTSRNTENYKNRMAKVQEDELQLRREIFEAENNKQPVGQQLKAPQILELSSRIQAVAKADELTDFLEDADFTFLEKGRYSLDNVPQLLFGGDAAEAEARRQSLIQAIASSYGGTLSNQDIERIDKQLFTQKDEMKTSLDIAKVFRSTLVGSLERDLRLLEGGNFNVDYIRNDLYETDQGQSESDADRLGNILSDNPLDRISRQ